jgi:hypothetical protein
MVSRLSRQADPTLCYLFDIMKLSVVPSLPCQDFSGRGGHRSGGDIVLARLAPAACAAATPASRHPLWESTPRPQLFEHRSWRQSRRVHHQAVLQGDLQTVSHSDGGQVTVLGKGGVTRAVKIPASGGASSLESPDPPPVFCGAPPFVGDSQYDADSPEGPARQPRPGGFRYLSFMSGFIILEE